MAIAGKTATIEASATAGGASGYSTVTEIRSVSFKEKGNNIDASALGNTFMARIQALKDITWSLSGFWAPGDTTGQVRIRAAWLNDTELWLQYKPNGSAGFKQQVRVSAFDIDASVDGAVPVSIECEGTGAPAAV